MKSEKAKFTITLQSVGDPDHDQHFETGVLSPTFHRHCASVEECQQAVRDYATEHFLSAGNWIGGEVKEDGKIIGRISYNGRFWPLKQKSTGTVEAPDSVH